MAYLQPPYRHSDHHVILELCAKEILSFIKPKEEDAAKRWNAISEFAGAIQSDQSLIGVSINPFGSFVSNLYTRWGDLDISIDLTQSKFCPLVRKYKTNVLQRIKWALERTGVGFKVEFIRNARVPVVVYQSKYYNISCDISINNYSGYIKSYILRWICNMDERFHEFVLLIKEWAKAQEVNDPKSGTLNSYSLCLLIIFHFQTCKPAIFPPLKELYKGNIVDDIKGHNTVRHIEDSFTAKIARYRSQVSRERNQSSLCHLLISFFDKFSRLDAVASNYVICTYTGSWEPINSNYRWMEKKAHHLLIEDPFEQDDNAARAVGFRGLREISQAFMNTYRKLSTRSVLKDRNSLLNILVRSEIRSNFPTRMQEIHDRFPKTLDKAQPPRCYYTIRSQFLNDARLDGHHQSPSSSRSYDRQGAAERQGHEMLRQTEISVLLWSLVIRRNLSVGFVHAIVFC